MKQRKSVGGIPQKYTSLSPSRRRLRGILLAFLLSTYSALSQFHPYPVVEKDRFSSFQKHAASSASGWFDVTHYMLDLAITTQPNYLKGDVKIAGVCKRDSSSSLTLDLTNTMRVDSVRVNGQKVTYAQAAGALNIALLPAAALGSSLSVEIFYRGIPVPTGFGSFVFDSHLGVPWIYSLSEPFGARDWWPCKDDPSDKADSADIIVTCDSTFKVGSQGKLVSAVNHGDGTTTYHWQEQYPIASYLISLAISNYAQFSNWFRYSPTDSMEVLNYVLPEHYSKATVVLPRVVDMLSIYSELFGLYPFINEKYGHAEFAGGGMEHQTMTSIGIFEEDVVAHELAHQWFGDMITCRSWADLWLNEGFAQYCTALYRERKYGSVSYWDYMDKQVHAAASASGSVGVPDTITPGSLFNSALIYSKGAAVLHMLRHLVGDTLFFRALRAYANDPLLKYSTASSVDLQRVFENASGKSLSYFFREWLYGVGFPDYEYSWEWKPGGDSSSLTIVIQQPITQQRPTFFTMPIDVHISSEGRDTLVTLFNDAQVQTFTLRYPSKPTAVMLDPQGWILKQTFLLSSLPPSGYVLEQNYPNPFNAGTKIKYELPRSSYVTLKIYDVLGREVTTLVDGRQNPGIYVYQWTPLSNSSGVYIYRLSAGDARLQKKMILQK